MADSYEQLKAHFDRIAEENRHKRAELYSRLTRLTAKWREDACGVDAMGYSQQADRIRDCADELDAILK